MSVNLSDIAILSIKGSNYCWIVDNDKIVVSNKVPFGKKGFKYFIGYKDAEKLSLFV